MSQNIHGSSSSPLAATGSATNSSYCSQAQTSYRLQVSTVERWKGGRKSMRCGLKGCHPHRPLWNYAIVQRLWWKKLASVSQTISAHTVPKNQLPMQQNPGEVLKKEQQRTGKLSFQSNCVKLLLSFALFLFSSITNWSEKNWSKLAHTAIM